MPPSPYKRNRRMKSRLMAGSEDDRVNLRTKAVEMMTGGRKAPDRGPVAHAYVPGRDSGKATHPRPKTTGLGPKPPVDPYAPRRTGDVVHGTKVPTGPNGRPISSGHVPVRPAAPRPHQPRSRSGDVVRGTKVPTGPNGPINTAYAPVVPRGPRPHVIHRPKPESGGTGNHAAPQTAIKNDTLDKGARRPVAKRPASAYDNQLSSLARQRALSGNRNNTGTRTLMSPAPTGTGGVAWRRTRAYRMGRRIQRNRANRWLRNVAQGPSRKLYT